MTEKKSFWSSLPGVIAGIATILTAGVALISLIASNGNDPQPQATETASPSTTATAGSSGSSGSGSGSGSGVNAPRAVIAPKTIDFGDLGTGRSARQTVTVTNSGSEYLVVEEVTVDSPAGAFSMTAESCLAEQTGIAPDDECEIEVTFTPGSAGSFAGFLVIEHSAAGSPERVALSGNGRLLGL